MTVDLFMPPATPFDTQMNCVASKRKILSIHKLIAKSPREVSFSLPALLHINIDYVSIEHS
jgi:hypothetical protein